MATDDPRCPYCIEDDDFKLLTPVGNEFFYCKRCGHLGSPSEPKFVCDCMPLAGLTERQPATYRNDQLAIYPKHPPLSAPGN